MSVVNPFWSTATTHAQDCARFSATRISYLISRLGRELEGRPPTSMRVLSSMCALVVAWAAVSAALLAQ